jgi:uncharacterized membrane protein
MTLRKGWRYSGESGAGPERLETLADGVFAIVMTLLVLELGVPVVADATSGEITEALKEMWPEFLIYFLSFLVLGVFWMMHKMIFDAIEIGDTPLIWLNVLFMAVAALIPFSTALVAEYRNLTIVALVYGLNMLAAFAAAWAIWAYATQGRRLTSDDLDTVLIKGGNRMGIVYFAVLCTITALAFASPLAAYIAYAAFIALIIGSTMLGRWEAVMIWAKEDDTRPPQ